MSDAWCGGLHAAALVSVLAYFVEVNKSTAILGMPRDADKLGGDTMQQDEREFLAKQEFGYLSTVGRVSGKTHTIEIWFVLEAATIYLLSGGRDQADWVKNARQNPQVSMRIAEQVFAGRARLLVAGEEDRQARDLVFAKYQPIHDEDLRDWRERSLAVAIDLV